MSGLMKCSQCGAPVEVIGQTNAMLADNWTNTERALTAARLDIEREKQESAKHYNRVASLLFGPVGEQLRCGDVQGWLKDYVDAQAELVVAKADIDLHVQAAKKWEDLATHWHAEYTKADGKHFQAEAELAAMRESVKAYAEDDIVLDSIACFEEDGRGHGSTTWRTVITEWRKFKAINAARKP